MKSYQVLISDKAIKQLNKLENRIGLIVSEKIQSLAEDPRPEGCKKLAGLKNTYRVRVRAMRIVYSVDTKKILVFVLCIGHRKDIYRIFKR